MLVWELAGGVLLVGNRTAGLKQPGDYSQGLFVCASEVGGCAGLLYHGLEQKHCEAPLDWHTGTRNGVACCEVLCCSLDDQCVGGAVTCLTALVESRLGVCGY